MSFAIALCTLFVVCVGVNLYKICRSRSVSACHMLCLIWVNWGQRKFLSFYACLIAAMSTSCVSVFTSTLVWLLISSAAWPAWIAWSSVMSCSLNRCSLRWRSFMQIIRMSLTSESVRFPNSQSAARWQSTVTKLLNFCPLDCLLVRTLCLRIIRFFWGWHYAFDCSMPLSMLYLSLTEVN